MATTSDELYLEIRVAKRVGKVAIGVGFLNMAVVGVLGGELTGSPEFYAIAAVAYLVGMLMILVPLGEYRDGYARRLMGRVFKIDYSEPPDKIRQAEVADER